ncbi:amidohydrolase [Algivirga pacifica]|uniref:Amidohydrolase n=1 Tax=Algivirga pacifica TaxID=1162670 RepID=A0ABP9DHH9_9BACT
MLTTDLTTLRREFHAIAEVSGKEYHTAKKVVEVLQTLNPTEVISPIGGTGVIAVFDSFQEGPTILFRCELDALPIQEINTFAHRSITEGVSHKCGHDGHLTSMLGLAKQLSQTPPKKGKVLLVFQPAEENGEGAKAILEDDKFDTLSPDYVFAFHNLPGYPLNKIIYKPASFTASVKSIIIKLHGKTAHAAEPEHGDNPALALSRILQESLKLANNNPDDEKLTVITPIHINMGELAYGISAGYGELHLTVRTWTEDYLEHISDQIVALSKKIASEENLTPEIAFTQHFQANENHPEAMEHLLSAIKECDLPAAERAYPFKWGEDFGLFTQKYKGAMFGIGSGENCPALHNPDYDYPDEITPVAVRLFHQIALRIAEVYQTA